jgi:hypothetical protein
MLRRSRSWLFGATLFWLITSTSASGVISPSYVMFYGSPLDTPIVRSMWPGVAEFLWKPYRSGGSIPAELAGGPYVNFAVFWGLWREPPTTPDGASQHGRLYLATPTSRAFIVMTGAAMSDGTPERPKARPIPTSLAGFLSGWPMTASDVGVARGLGVPGF